MSEKDKTEILERAKEAVSELNDFDLGYLLGKAEEHKKIQEEKDA